MKKLFNHYHITYKELEKKRIKDLEIKECFNRIYKLFNVSKCCVLVA